MVGFAELKMRQTIFKLYLGGACRVDHLLYGSARDGIMVGGCVDFGAKNGIHGGENTSCAAGGRSLARALQYYYYYARCGCRAD